MCNVPKGLRICLVEAQNAKNSLTLQECGGSCFEIQILITDVSIFEADKMMESITEWRILAHNPALPARTPAHCKRTFCGKFVSTLLWPKFKDPSPTFGGFGLCYKTCFQSLT